MKHLVIVIPWVKFCEKTPYPQQVPLSVESESKGPQKNTTKEKPATKSMRNLETLLWKANTSKNYLVNNWWLSLIAI